MLVVALLLLPAMGFLMIAMDRIEDLLNGEARRRTGRHAHHLRLIHGGARTGQHRATASGRRKEAA
ncbi:hypothetical protein GCM10010277_03370 [Streptomyces longisporoflavus]|nr:hypothetical protein GCM10010277_03370 [Streptomyces longisporoflavus]